MSAGWPSVVSITTGTFLIVLLWAICSIISRPLIRGMLMSQITIEMSVSSESLLRPSTPSTASTIS